MTERMNQLNDLTEPRFKEIELNQSGWYCNRLNQQYKKNDIEFNDANEAYDYEFDGVSDE